AASVCSSQSTGSWKWASTSMMRMVASDVSPNNKGGREKARSVGAGAGGRLGRAGDADAGAAQPLRQHVGERDRWREQPGAVGQPVALEREAQRGFANELHGCPVAGVTAIGDARPHMRVIVGACDEIGLEETVVHRRLGRPFTGRWAEAL